MKNLINKNIIRFALVIFIIAISISCVDSLNSPYPGTSINSKPGDSISEAFTVAEEIEFVARIYYQTKCVGLPPLIPKDEMERVLEKLKTYGQKK